MVGVRYDAVIIGAGAAGLMCAATAGGRGRKVAILEHGDRIGRKLLVSGGGRCNFSNLSVSGGDYITGSPEFVGRVLENFDPDIIFGLLKAHKISYYEKEAGQLFCKQPSKVLLSALRKECEKGGARIFRGLEITDLKKEMSFLIGTSQGVFETGSLVVATGGLSYRRLGASDLGHKIARRFGLKVTECRPGLVPLVFDSKDIGIFGPLSGVSFDAKVSCGESSFKGGVLFTHRGLSGPAVLQLSSCWRPGMRIVIDLRGTDIPKRLAKIADGAPLLEFTPKGTAGYEHAEVTVGGVDLNGLSPLTMEARNVPGLYFIGEVTDAAGRLGGYNLHWAWASGYLAGMAV